MMKKTGAAARVAVMLVALAAIAASAFGGALAAFADTGGNAGGAAVYAAAGNEGWYALISSGALLFAMIAVKLIFFNRHRLKIKAGLKAADDMDPLLVGKLIDNKAHDTDLAALIFYWANGGYIKLDMSEKKPAVTKLKNLPAMSPDYELKLFYGIFRRRNHFVFEGESLFSVAGGVKKSTDERARGSFYSASIGVSVLFALLFGLTLGLYPMLYAMFGEKGSYSELTGFVFLIPALIAYGLSETLLYNRFKFGRRGKALYGAAIFLLCAGGTAVYAVVIPDYILALAPRIFIGFIGMFGSSASSCLIERTESYNGKLGEILSLRAFILSATEPDMRDYMRSDPDIFIKIYPYAYVLNLGERWAENFTNTKLKAPEWCERAGKTLQGAGELVGAMDNAMTKIAASFVARPAHEKPEQD